MKWQLLKDLWAQRVSDLASVLVLVLVLALGLASSSYQEYW